MVLHTTKGLALRQQPNQAREPNATTIGILFRSLTLPVEGQQVMAPSIQHVSKGRLGAPTPSHKTEASLRLYYTAVKALALASASRPGLPVEIILNVCQLAGFANPLPNGSVYTEVMFDRGATNTPMALVDSSNEIRPWLCTPPLSPSLLKKVWQAEPLIHPAEPVMSRTHAFRPDELVVRIAKGPFGCNYKTDSDGKRLTWRHLTTRISREPAYPLRIFDRCHEIWEWVEPGDRIEIGVDAAGWYFPNIRSEWGVSLRIYTAWEPSETMLRLIYECGR
ncbi:hypothetical protein RSOLAG1IB_07827 [Rhizoctonia solani AG-1 IB]|uniref:Uncharacterized protein n=1 Tax=Thanatephorus cucumeris (strain AG1-IB / isolate 7/3/14) TaxID=1108050 RepID=A0A0B7FFP0_THACB|nr:hypothetical protein RSOLAG1IB_07827 [Rhizoctonia solani AG-1 IB]